MPWQWPRYDHVRCSNQKLIPIPTLIFQVHQPAWRSSSSSPALTLWTAILHGNQGSSLPGMGMLHRSSETAISGGQVMLSDQPLCVSDSGCYFCLSGRDDLFLQFVALLHQFLVACHRFLLRGIASVAHVTIHQCTSCRGTNARRNRDIATPGHCRYTLAGLPKVRRTADSRKTCRSSIPSRQPFKPHSQN